MARTIDGAPRKIGLALSGGGYRAAAFHHGTLTALDELGILPDVDVISCVSGGSIAGAFMAANWGSDSALDDLKGFLTTRSIAVSSFVAGALDPFETRTDKLADALEKHLLRERSLGDLSGGPRLYLNTTNLATGNLLSFVTGGQDPSVITDWELGVADATNYRLADAVAGSCAFPPVFPPLQIPETVFPNEETEYITVCDGGVYDNLAVNPLINDVNNVEFAIVSDGGMPFFLDETPTIFGAVVLKDMIAVMMEQSRGQQFQRLVDRMNLAKLERDVDASKPMFRPTWFSLDSEALQREKYGHFASQVRTNLKRLSKLEFSTLSAHGKRLTLSRVRKFQGELLRP